MQIEGGDGACLTVEQSGALCAVAEEQRDLETCGAEVDQLLTMQRRLRRAHHEATRGGRICPGQEHHQTSATLQRRVPHDGGRQVPMRRICSCAAILATAHVVAVDLPVILPPCPASLR